jgi:hypothetical protein
MFDARIMSARGPAWGSDGAQASLGFATEGTQYAVARASQSRSGSLNGPLAYCDQRDGGWIVRIDTMEGDRLYLGRDLVTGRWYATTHAAEWFKSSERALAVLCNVNLCGLEVRS